MPKDMLAFIAGRFETFISDLETLVNIDSGSDNLAGVETVARVLVPRLKAIGFTTYLKKLGKRGVPCLEAFNTSEKETSDILFLGHMDTVFPDDEAVKRPFCVNGSRGTGPGVSDMKGGLVLALHSLESLHNASLLDRLAIRVCFNEDAEEGISAHVTVLRSGAKTNIIPDTARAKIDVRVARKDQIDRVESFFRSMPDRTHVPGVSLTVCGGVERPPMEADDRAMALWRLFGKQAESIGLTVDAITTGGCSDYRWVGNFPQIRVVPRPFRH